MPVHRRHRLVSLFALLLLLAALPVGETTAQGRQWTAAEAPRPADPFLVFGYHAWWMADSWQRYDLEAVDKLFFFELRVGPDGRFAETNGWPTAPTALLAEARRRGKTVVPTIALLEEAAYRRVLTDAAAQQRLLDGIMDVVRGAGAPGVHLNFEMYAPVGVGLREALTVFVQRLRRALDAYRPGAELTVFTPGFDHVEAYDEAALAQVADYLVVQGYDLHWATGPSAGPLAPLAGWGGVNWQAIVSRYTALGVPRRKIVMTVPYYGYEWPTVSERPGAATRGRAQTLTYAPVDASYLPLIRLNAQEGIFLHGLRRDPTTGTPYYAYRGHDGWYQGWFEDAESLRAKVAFVRRERLAGVAVFLLGYDGGALDAVWQAR